jgi:pseudouridine-5'-phosphate glycosidase
VPIQRALDDAVIAGDTGKRLTPFLLARLAEVTGGASVRANRALALNNAKVAAELAVAFASLV